jgi:hypothetical protein
MRQVITADGFPHGTNRGYELHCGCDPCRDARRSYTKRLTLSRTRGALADGQHVDASAARAHLAELRRQVPLASNYTLRRVTGLSQGTIERLIDGSATRIAVRSARRLLDTSVEDVRAAAFCVDPTDTWNKVRQLQAAGYPVRWQSEQINVARAALVGGDGRELITAKVAEAVADLHRRVGLRLATPATTGVNQRIITRVRIEARKLGYYPPGCYDDNGDLDPRSIPDHPWSMADERAGQCLAILRDILDGELSHADIAVRYGVSDRKVGRVAGAVGVVHTNPEREQAETTARAVLDAYDHTDLDPVHAALRLHLFTSGYAIPSDHPGLLAYQAETDSLGVAA